MNFQTMEYFVVLAHELNFTRAAEKLHITQQSLSSHIASVERELGCQLLERKNPLQLTFAGRTFLRYAVQYENSMQSMRQEFADIRGEEKGELRVGIGYTRAQMLMPHIIPVFQERYPQVTVSLLEGMEKPQAILDGKLDLIISNWFESVPELSYQDFYEERVVLIVPKQWMKKLKVTRAEIEAAVQENQLNPLRECPFLLLEDPQVLTSRTANHLIRNSDFTPQVRLRTRSMSVLLGHCLQGMGASFTPEHMIYSILNEEQQEHMEVFRLSSEVLAKHMIRFGYLKQTYQWSVLQEFIACAKNVYRELQKVRLEERIAEK